MSSSAKGPRSASSASVGRGWIRVSDGPSSSTPVISRACRAAPDPADARISSRLSPSTDSASSGATMRISCDSTAPITPSGQVVRAMKSDSSGEPPSMPSGSSSWTTTVSGDSSSRSGSSASATSSVGTRANSVGGASQPSAWTKSTASRVARLRACGVSARLSGMGGAFLVSGGAGIARGRPGSRRRRRVRPESPRRAESLAALGEQAGYRVCPQGFFNRVGDDRTTRND